jgi:glycosyltransferase involved in cell wall biosynthesis
MNTDTQQSRVIETPPEKPVAPVAPAPVVAPAAAAATPAPVVLPRPASPIGPHGEGLSVVIPAYNEGDSIGVILGKIRQLKPAAEVIVVDDGSSDNTAPAAASHGVRVVRHPYNKGNGAAVKTGIRAAHGEVVLLIDADGQHQPEDIERVLAGIGEYDLVVGARTQGAARGLVRDVGNAFFNQLASYMVGRPIPDLTSGFRAMRRPLILEFIHLLPNGYSYPTTSTLSFMKAGYNVQFVPIRARKASGKSQIKVIKDGTKFVVIIFRIITLFNPMRVFLPLSLVLFLPGLAYGLYNFALAADHRIPNGAVILIMTSILVFLFGLISEQIAAMRFENTQRMPDAGFHPSGGGNFEWPTEGTPATPPTARPETPPDER